ncbi:MULTISPECIES: tetratricopeptide repeat protein [Fischerella]|nr:tetratricopeptide repeat protein [Fischerella muscicola]MBD2432848.1 tetratricopeptide repeat protein [Fischerella sp. FACHB-380]
MYKQALEICERQLGENHPDTVTVRENLAILRAELNSEQ